MCPVSRAESLLPVALPDVGAQVMSIIFSDMYAVDIGPHPWHTSKYRHVLEILKTCGAIQDSQVLDAPIAEDEDILRVHTMEYWRKLYDLQFTEEEIIRAEIPLTSEIVDLFWRMTGGTILAGEQALQDGICVHLGGGFHHAYPNYASGFCLLNDIAIGIQVLLDCGAIQNAAVIDCDLHQGDATARIFRNDSRVFTLSLHQGNAFPYFKQQSSLDVDLPSGTGDKAYLAALDSALTTVFAGGRTFDFIHYQAGVDTFANDLLGGLKLSESGLRERDRRVIGAALSSKIPLVITLGGGYTADVNAVARLHANTVVEALEQGGCFAPGGDRTSCSLIRD